jgi:hypothetical protein
MPLGRFKQKGFKVNGTHQCLVYGDVLLYWAETYKQVNKHTGALLDTNKEIYLEINLGQIKCMLIYCKHDAGKR